MGNESIFGNDINRPSASCSQPVFSSFTGPRLWERRQKLDFGVLALEQHLGDAGTAAKVSVDLERQMAVEHIGLSGFSQKSDQVIMSDKWFMMGSLGRTV